MHLAPYVPQLITAVATLGAVVLTLIFTGRREAKRFQAQLQWEREKLQEEHREAGLARLLDIRLRSATEFLDLSLAVIRRTISLAKSKAPDPAKLAELRTWRSELRPTGTRLVLVVPVLRDELNAVRFKLVEPKLGDLNNLPEEWQIEASKLIRALTLKMSQFIDTDSAAIVLHAQDQPDERSVEEQDTKPE